MRISYLGSGRAMEKRFACSLVVLAVVWHCGSASAQSSSGLSINIDCGATANTIDAVGVQWVTDAGYIPTGTNHQGFNLPTDSTFATFSELTSLRAFADTRAKNCYRLPVVKNATYLLRAAFFYGNYDNATTPPSFQLSLEATVVENVTTYLTEVQYKEILYISQSTVTDLCFLRDGANGGTPFVSSISLRQVTEVYERFNMYLGNSQYMTIRTRINFGGSTLVRYPDDRYDRYWHPEGSMSPYLSLTPTPVQALGINTSIPSEDFRPPSVVMQSAVTTTGNLVSYYLTPGSPSDVVYDPSFIILHFAELDPAATNTSRVFDMDVGTGGVRTKMNPYNESGGVFERVTWLFWNREIRATTQLTLLPDSLTVKGPILNSMEMYSVSDVRNATTREVDVKAIEAIKADMNLSEWTGDPCVPLPYPWVQCSAPGSVLEAPVVTAINLTGYNLIGSISPSFANLVGLTSLSLGYNALTGLLPDLSPLVLLTTLNLENNTLTGPLPDWLTTLPLKMLTVQNNNFSGTIPAGLRTSSNLEFTPCPGNTLVGSDCMEAATTSKKSSNLPAIIGATAGGLVLALLIIIMGICIGFRCRRRKANPQQNSGGSSGRAVPLQEIVGSNSGSSKAFSLAALATATNNFQNEIGRGGFGPVYHGVLPDGREVAVKVAENPNRSGDQEFHNEVSLLSKLHHRNLTTLVGYCQEKKKQILVYEYVRDGSLYDQLHGKLKSSRPLDWRMRLNIALNAARGLDYLHSNCQPSIIHRDVKSGNILLTGPGHIEVAKVSDFGLSRAGPVQDNTHVSTEIRGTAGYLDPQYFDTQKLTLKSDVFSFGVVLLELITGRLPIDSSVANRDDWNLCQYVRNVLGGGSDVDIEQILDPAVRACRPNLDAVWVVAEVALRSVEPKAVHRPTMADVLQELQTAVALELRASQASPAIKQQQQQQQHSPHAQSHERFISQPDSMIFYESDTMPEPR